METVYVLTNPAMPGLVKIGRTVNDVMGRISQLYSTGVPVPFDLAFACRVPDSVEVERAMHLAFGPYRLNSKREFFQIAPEQAIAILKLLHAEDATSEVNAEPRAEDQESLEAGQRLRKKRRPNLDFEVLQIPVGAVLHSTHDDTEVTVCSPRKVLLGTEELSLTAATERVIKQGYAVAPGPHWTYQGKTIREIYEGVHGEEGGDA